MQTQREQETPAMSLLAAPSAQQGEQTQAEEHRPAEKAACKRIVSKGRYAANIGKKAALSSVSAAILLFGVLSVLAACVCVLALLIQPAAGLVTPLLWLLLLFGGGGLCLLYLGSRAIKEATQIYTGVPLTRANIADIPANDSLVRASAHPTQAQDAVLLRAAVATQERREAQLLRSSVGERE